MKKAISAATSAALLASLLATAVAPSAFAANTSTGGGTIFPGQAASAAGSITFAEDIHDPAPFRDQFATARSRSRSSTTMGASEVSFDATAAPTITASRGVGSATAAFAQSVAAGPFDHLNVSVAGTDTPRSTRSRSAT